MAAERRDSLQVGIIGAGRMGKVLAKQLSGHVDVILYDHSSDLLNKVGTKFGVSTASGMEELAATGTIILAVPDREVVNCVKELNQMKRPVVVLNIATNVVQSALEDIAAAHIRCISVKFVGHAGEIAAGNKPVIIINEQPEDLTQLAVKIFSPIGNIVLGKADIVTRINSFAAEKAIEAAVIIEEGLRAEGINDQAIIRSAIRQVAAGVIKAYANDDLGPFARQIVHAVKSKMRNK